MNTRRGEFCCAQSFRTAAQQPHGTGAGEGNGLTVDEAHRRNEVACRVETVGRLEREATGGSWPSPGAG